MNRFEPWNEGHRLKVVVGHYGSGKSELSLNLALAARAQGLEATVVDLDIVNPFFRSAEQGALLSAKGIRLIAPPYALTGVDMPVLTAEVLSVFEFPDRPTVLDVGGDDAGAAALGRYKPQFDRCPPDVYYVVNPYRPYSETVEQVIDMMARIASRARLCVTGLVNNANLGEETTPEQLLRGQLLLGEVSRRTQVPIAFMSGVQPVVEALSSDRADATPVFPIKRLLMPEWLIER
ncbi:MAG: cobalamin biosynthesis protein CbiA [Clostridia bacterium]